MAQAAPKSQAFAQSPQVSRTSTLSPDAWTEGPRLANLTGVHRTEKARQLPLTVFLWIIWQCLQFFSLCVLMISRIMRPQGDNWLGAPTQFCYFWKVSQASSLPHSSRTVFSRLWWRLKMPATHWSLTTGPFSPLSSRVSSSAPAKLENSFSPVIIALF